MDKAAEVERPVLRGQQGSEGRCGEGSKGRRIGTCGKGSRGREVCVEEAALSRVRRIGVEEGLPYKGIISSTQRDTKGGNQWILCVVKGVLGQKYYESDYWVELTS